MASITVVGTGFTGATMCYFGTIGVTIDLNAAGTSFTCIPPGQTGTVNIGITGYGRTVAKPSGYTYMGSPTITSLGVTSGSTAGGTVVHIYGTNFYDRIGITFPGYYCGVSFGTVGTTSDIYGITHCYVITPVSSVAGAVSFKLKTPTGVAIGLTFTYINYCTCVTPSSSPICNTGVTSSCLNDTGPAGRTGCNCCACCSAVCDLDPTCCADANWALCNSGNGGSELVRSAIAAANPGDAIYLACKHLVRGSCCVKFNVVGASYGICLSPQGSSAECTDLVNRLHAGNSGASPWNNAYTYNFIEGGDCSGCSLACSGSCLSGTTCTSLAVGCPCCLQYGYCGGGCICDTSASCGSGLIWDTITCRCVSAIGGF